MSQDIAIFLICTLAIIAGIFVAGTNIKNSLGRVETVLPIHHSPTSNITVSPILSPEKTLLFVGDIMLARSVATQIRTHNDFSYPFRLIADTLKSADVTFGNLEGPISTRGKNQGSIYSFRADPRTIEGLILSGFDVLSLANNHIWDWGTDALTDTVTLLKGNGIHPIGAGLNKTEANTPLMFSGGDTKLAFLAYTNLYPKSLEAGDARPGISSFDVERSSALVKEIKEHKTADLVIVSFHWGEEYKTRSNASQQKIARGLIDAGADLIIGHHPHVVQEIEHYKHGWIAYSLGNFVFDQYFSEETMKGLMVSATLKNKQITSFKEIPITISKTYQPFITE